MMNENEMDHAAGDGIRSPIIETSEIVWYRCPDCASRFTNIENYEKHTAVCCGNTHDMAVSLWGRYVYGTKDGDEYLARVYGVDHNRVLVKGCRLIWLNDATGSVMIVREDREVFYPSELTPLDSPGDVMRVWGGFTEARDGFEFRKFLGELQFSKEESE